MTLSERLATKPCRLGCGCIKASCEPCAEGMHIWLAGHYQPRREPEWMRRKRELGLPAKEMTLA
jgi:hypothetical protein